MDSQYRMARKTLRHLIDIIMTARRRARACWCCVVHRMTRSSILQKAASTLCLVTGHLASASTKAFQSVQEIKLQVSAKAISLSTMADDTASTAHSTASGMSQDEQEVRRKQIREIMKDPSLSQAEKSRGIQSLMDGRRRSSCATSSVCSGASGDYVNSMAHAAAAAAEYYSSDDEGDAIMEPEEEGLGHISYGYDEDDARSVTSEITHASQQSYHSHQSHQSHHSQQSQQSQQSQHQQHQQVIPPGTYRQIHGRSYSLQDWNDSDRAIAAASTTIQHDNPIAVNRLMEQSRPPCQHYERNCTIVSPCCGLAFGCRICHDECPVLPAPWNRRKREQQAVGLMSSNKKSERRRSMPADLMGGDDEENHHPIDRFAIREIICRECCTRQSSKT